MAGPAPLSYAAVTAGSAPSTVSCLPFTERCLNCPKEGILPLDCGQHKLCSKCLKTNAIKYGAEKLDVCPACAEPPSPSSPIWIFVDNSNIWIGAKKLASKVKGFKSLTDHRVRLNIGNLTDVVAKSREVKTGVLYGSEPPQIDSVWDKIREYKGWSVKTKKKSFLTHKEKEVDAQLLVDVTEVACTTPVNDRGTVVLITGDADMCPAVEKIISYEGWKVEIYMWEDSLSDRLKKLSRQNVNVICEPLDNRMKEVVFTNKKFPVSQYEIPTECSAVLTMKPECFPKRVPDSDWWLKLESIAQWPVQYWWIIEDGEETDDMLLVFSHVGEKHKYSVSDFVQQIMMIMNDEDCSMLPHAERAETYIDYKKRKRYFEAVMKYGRFHITDCDENDSNYVLRKSKAGSSRVIKQPAFNRQIHVVDTTHSSAHATTDTGKFEFVPPTKVGGKLKKCPFEKNCIQGVKCELQHSDGDKIFFEANNGQGMPLSKNTTVQKISSLSQRSLQVQLCPWRQRWMVLNLPQTWPLYEGMST